MMDTTKLFSICLCCVLLVREGYSNVVREFKRQVTEPMTTEMPVTEVATITLYREYISPEPDRSSYQGWNREQIMQYMAENDPSPQDQTAFEAITTEESLKQRRIAEIQTHILQTLGIDDPTSYSTPKLSEAQEDLLISSLNRTRPSSKTFECIVASCDIPEEQYDHISHNLNSKSMQLYFETYFWDDDKKIAHSVLKLRLKDDSNCNHRSCRNEANARLEVRVYMYLNTNRPNRSPRKLLVDAKVVSQLEERWVLLNIKPAIKRWKRFPDTNYGLEIVVRNIQEQRRDANRLFVGLNCTNNDTNFCLPAHSEEEAVGIPQTVTESESYMEPSLHIVKKNKKTIFTVDLESNREKREAKDMPPCSKQPLMVSLSDFGWNNLTFTPGAIDVGICVGRCLSDEDDSLECTRCMPTKMSSMYLTFEDSKGNSGAGDVDDVIVEDCAVIPKEEQGR